MGHLVMSISELHAKASELKSLIADAQSERGLQLQDAQYHLEAAISVIARNAADDSKPMSSLREAEDKQAFTSRAGVAGYQHFSAYAR